MTPLAAALAILLTAPLAGVRVEEIDYRGWPGSVYLTNGQVDVVLVPAVGRLMRFAYTWDDNPLWENPALYGSARPETATDWFNFGGDKAWPAEQDRWPADMGRAWPPDTALDGLPHRAEILGDGTVRLISPVSTTYGVRAIRTFRLDPRRPRLTIVQRFQKVQGPAKLCTIWNVTQCDHPDVVYLPTYTAGSFKAGYRNISLPTKKPGNHRVAEGVLQITRDPALPSKFGSDSPAGWIAWVKGSLVVSEHLTYVSGGSYPDKGCCEEVYTSPDAAGEYIEMELLSPQ
ncbi:MAG: hypothetical protein HYU66_16985, partial [Armatimonadetes bacterium]|nr:hypothetical protein [Armatimonadota bacterium]